MVIVSVPQPSGYCNTLGSNITHYTIMRLIGEHMVQLRCSYYYYECMIHFHGIDLKSNDGLINFNDWHIRKLGLFIQ